MNPAALHGLSSSIALMVSLRVGGLSSSTLVGSCGMQRTAKTWTVRFALKSVSKCLDQCLRGLDCEELLIIPCSPCSLHTAESSGPGAPTSPSGSPRACLEGCCRLDGSWLSSQDRKAVLGGPGGLTSSRLVVIVSPCHFIKPVLVLLFGVTKNFFRRLQDGGLHLSHWDSGDASFVQAGS